MFETDYTNSAFFFLTLKNNGYVIDIYGYDVECSIFNTPVPQSFWLILHSSEARFISSGHLWKTIVSQSDEFDLCLSTIRPVSDLHLVPSSGHFHLIRSALTHQTLTR